MTSCVCEVGAPMQSEMAPERLRMVWVGRHA